ncbi:MAG: hypothetical protein QM820_59020 [Minicystis sp.]
MSIAASVVAAGCAEQAEVASASAALTATDVDVAPECQGVITFVNTASFAKLDEYLPSNVAQNLVNRRATSPFVSIADVSSVSLVGDARLTQIYQGARTEAYVGASCVGIYDQLAVSSDDEQAMVALVNSISSTELHDILPDAWNGASNLLNTRPFTTAAQISNTSGIGPSSIRRIRNAATLAKPFEQLAAAATGLHRDADILAHFDWFQAVVTADNHYHQGSLTCFGVPLDYMPSGTTIRPNLADATEVYNEVVSTLTFANRYNELAIDPAPGLANLQSLLAGGEFFGCYISYADDPWSGNNRAFFVNPDTGFGVLTETRWSE